MVASRQVVLAPGFAAGGKLELTNNALISTGTAAAAEALITGGQVLSTNAEGSSLWMMEAASTDIFTMRDTLPVQKAE